MESQQTQSIAIFNTTLALKGIKSYLFQILFIGLAVALPAVAHLTNAPVRYLLPMHWTILLAGLVYGWRGGAVSGLLSPTVSFLITGMPPANILMPMTLELAAYGCIAGLMRENFKLNPFVSLLTAIIAGRMIYLISALSLGLISTDIFTYSQSSLFPGFAAAAGQIIILPFIAKWWINKERETD